MLPAYFLAGVLFGIVLTKGELVSWFRIQEALRFDGLYIYEVLASAFVVAAPLFWWLKRRRLRSLAGEPIAIPPKALGRGRRYVLGGAIFGLGWGVTGVCPGPLLAQPRALIAMLWWSAVIWFLFEAINIRLQDWYYVFLPANPVERWAGITLSLATVVPAVLLPERVLDRLGVWRQLQWRPIAVGPKELRGASRLGWAALAATLAFPRYLH